jgi:hypothetical protein
VFEAAVLRRRQRADHVAAAADAQAEGALGPA